MTTKPSSSVQAASDKSLEKAAYEAVKDIPTAEPHDQDRLGFNVWRFLSFKVDPLEVCVRSAGARLLISEEEAVRRIQQNLKSQGLAD